MINRRVLRIAVALAWLCALIGPSAMPVAAADSRATNLSPALQSVIDKQRASLNIPGVAATVIFGDGSRWSGVSGNAALGPPTAATSQTPWVVGSITKTFMAALILQLSEDELLSIDDPLATWLPDYPNAANITLRQLLSHTSGVFDYFKHSKYSGAVFGDPGHHWTAAEILSRFAHAPYFAPGTGYHYSNTNYVLLGLVAEAVGGASVRDQLRSRFWEPLGLDRTYIQSAGVPPPDAAKGYLWSSGHFLEISDSSGYRPTRSAATVAWSVGDMVASADDIATWASVLYGGQVLEAASLTEMLDWERYPGGEGYGLGTSTQEWNGRRMFGHTGSIRGFVAAAWHIPSEDATFVVVTNRGRTNAHVAIPTALMEAVFVDASPPSVPAGLTGVAQAHRYVRLTWDPAIDNEPHTITYRLVRNGSNIGKRTTELSFLDRTPSVGTYLYEVLAIDAAGNKSAKSPPVTVTAFR